jgi:hypothetical protein
MSVLLDNQGMLYQYDIFVAELMYSIVRRTSWVDCRELLYIAV